MPVVHKNLIKHGENKDVIRWAQQHPYQNTPNLKSHMIHEQSNVLVRPKDVKMYLGETPWVETSSS